jgi:hypothetical protein
VIIKEKDSGLISSTIMMLCIFSHIYGISPTLEDTTGIPEAAASTTATPKLS